MRLPIHSVVVPVLGLLALSVIGTSEAGAEEVPADPYETRDAPRIDSFEEGDSFFLSYVPDDEEPSDPGPIRAAIETRLALRKLELTEEESADYHLVFGYGTRSRKEGRRKHFHYLSVIAIDAALNRSTGRSRVIWKGEARVQTPNRTPEDLAAMFQELAGQTLESLGRNREWHVSMTGILRRSAQAYADFQAGAAAYQRGDFVAALRDWYPLARFGDPMAQYRVGLMAFSGQGMAADNEESLRWIFGAARGGLADAQYHLGYLIAQGGELLADPVEAHRWMIRAAAQGLEEATEALPLLTERLEPEDLARAETLTDLATGTSNARFEAPRSVSDVPPDQLDSDSRTTAVLVSILVQRDGSVGSTTAVRCADEPAELESTAEDWRTDRAAIRSWLTCIDFGYSQRAVEMVRARQYEPASLDGKPVAWSTDSVVRVPPSSRLPGREATSSSSRFLAGVDDVTNPILIPESKIEPDFPELARVARLEGNVILQAIIHEDGTIGEIEVLRSNRPNMGFEVAAMEAVSHWRYKPALRHGKPVEVYFTIFIEFKFH